MTIFDKHHPADADKNWARWYLLNHHDTDPEDRATVRDVYEIARGWFLATSRGRARYRSLVEAITEAYGQFPTDWPEPYPRSTFVPFFAREMGGIEPAKQPDAAEVTALLYRANELVERATAEKREQLREQQPAAREFLRKCGVDPADQGAVRDLYERTRDAYITLALGHAEGVSEASYHTLVDAISAANLWVRWPLDWPAPTILFQAQPFRNVLTRRPADQAFPNFSPTGPGR